MLKVAMLTLILHLSKLGLSFVTDFFFNSGARTPITTDCLPCLPVWWAMWFELVMLFFWWLLPTTTINICHPWRWIAVVTWLNYLNLTIDRWGSDEVCCGPNFGLVHLTLHQPSCILWFLLLYAYVGLWNTLLLQRLLSSDKPGHLSAYDGEEKNSPCIFSNFNLSDW